MGDRNNSGFFGSSMGAFQIIGLLNAFKKGDARIDMVVAMFIPYILQLLQKLVERCDILMDFFKSWWQTHEKYSRYIVYRRTQNTNGNTVSLDGGDTQNTILLKAIQHYLHQECNLQLESANLNLTSMEDVASQRSQQYYDEYYDEYRDSDERETPAKWLSRYQIVKTPPQNIWHCVGEYGTPSALVKLCIHEAKSRGEGGDSSGEQQPSQKKELETVYHFVSSGESAIDVFIDEAYKWYLQELDKLEDNSRYLYDFKPPKPDSMRRHNGSHHVYTQYKLSDEKTFESLFFQQKETLLNLVQHFENKSGKYAVKGYPHKLGLLLHGPPGTGKTSLIKALAQHTGRSIVNLPLARITTNQELMSVFFDHNYQIEGEHIPQKLGFKDVIYVMEDVDAASRVVRRRTSKKASHDVASQPTKSIWRMLLESNDNECRELVELLMDKSKRLREEATKPQVLQSIAQRIKAVPGVMGQDVGDSVVETTDNKLQAYSTVDQFMGFHARSLKARLEAGAEVDDAFIDELLSTSSSPTANGWVLPSDVSDESDQNFLTDVDDADSEHNFMAVMQKFMNDDKTTKPSGISGWACKTEQDPLNLTGLLNVLDGVVDTPGRILIMTTNHPEMLDPALIRPGRIDKTILLGYMAAADVMSMLEHYFQEPLSDEYRERVESAIRGKRNFTPAQVEQLCAEHDDMEGMIQALEEQSNSSSTNAY